MAMIRRSISIQAPLPRVFDYFSDPAHLPELWPAMVAVRNIQPQATGRSFDWEYKLLGMRIHGHSDPVEFAQNERHVTRSVKGIPNTFRCLYTTRDGQTEVTIEVEYEVPVLGRLAEGLVGRVHQREAEALLGNLKRKMEA